MFAAADGSRQQGWHRAGTSFNLTLVARLRKDATPAEASAELGTLYSSFLLEAYGPTYDRDPARDAAFRERNRRARRVLGPLTGGLGDDLRQLPETRVTAWLVGIAFVLLGVACSNVAGLLLLRAVARRREIAMRLALGASRSRRRALLVRTASGATGVEANLRRMLLDLDPNLPFADIATLGEALEPQIRPWRLGASIFTAFGILAIILATIGLWSSVAYAVSQRTKEFAIRMTLGAQRASLIALMLREGVRAALLTTAAGLLAAAAASRYLTDLLYGVSPRDPLVFAAVAALMLSVGTLASMPAWRVAGIDPAAALRME